MADYSIRKASVMDAHKIASLHALSWKTTYRNIVPDSFLDNNLEKERKDHWVKELSTTNPKEFVLVAQSPTAELLGFIAILDKPDRGYEGFIDNLHVHPDAKGSGIGKKLMKVAAERFLHAGIKNVYLWVLIGNTKAEEFYKSRGGKPADQGLEKFGDHPVPATRFVWNSLEELLK